MSRERVIEAAGKLITAEDRERFGLDPNAPLTLEIVEAKRMAINIVVLLAGPQSERDGVWAKVNDDFSVRMYGKPKETVEITDGKPVIEVDWAKVPLETRKRLLGAMTEIDQLEELQGADEDNPQ